MVNRKIIGIIIIILLLLVSGVFIYSSYNIKYYLPNDFTTFICSETECVPECNREKGIITDCNIITQGLISDNNIVYNSEGEICDYVGKDGHGNNCAMETCIPIENGWNCTTEWVKGVE